MVAEEVVAAEWPSWHLLSCFGVFNLKHSEHNGKGVEEKLALLAKAFDVPANDVCVQYSNLFPVAAAIQERAGLDNRDAWRQAYASTSALKTRLPYRDSDALKQAMSSYFLFLIKCIMMINIILWLNLVTINFLFDFICAGALCILCLDFFYQRRRTNVCKNQAEPSGADLL